jgi:hypothetical protein
MNPTPSQRWWRWPNLLLWAVFFAIGLAPDMAYKGLRQAGGVLTQHAWVNSVQFLMFGLAGYFAWFVYCRCIEADIRPQEARGKALQMGILALAAFLPLELERFAWYRTHLTAESLRVIYAFALGKLLIWSYLVSVVLRYHFGGYEVFRRMPTLFPSARVAASEDAPARSAHDTEDRP